MSRKFKTADYDATLDVTVRLGDCLPPDHLARFVVDTIVKTVQIELPPPTDAATAHQMVEQFREYVDLGVAHFMLDFGVVTDPAVVRRIGEDVLAQFR